MNTDGLVLVGRPGYLGNHRDQKYAEWDVKYGKGAWELMWKLGKNWTNFLGACALYEDAYFCFLADNLVVLNQLLAEASEVYDDKLTNVNSGLDYMRQETERTHIQDIAIRRALTRMGAWFRGKELIRIRQEKGTHPLSITLSPGRVPFHRPDLITKPEKTGWWNPLSIEAFYQSNRYLFKKTQ